MDTKRMLTELDALFDQGRIQEVDAYLKNQLDRAKSESDAGAVLCIYNEQLGYYREMTNHTALEAVISDTETFLRENQRFQNTIEGATTKLNLANCYRAIGKLAVSEMLYYEVSQLYQKLLPRTDRRIAGLFNNMSLLFEAMGEDQKALNALRTALQIIEENDGSLTERAVTYTNLGQVYTRLKDYDQAEQSLFMAKDLFLKLHEQNQTIGITQVDSHYPGLVNALGALYVQKKQYPLAIQYYEEALYCIYQSVGKTENYKAIYGNLMEAYWLDNRPDYLTMIDLCRAYYEQYGKPMIHELFAEYEDQIAVGLVGEGSECLGFSDSLSEDHDYGPGFSMWVEDAVYEKIGEDLQKAYQSLPNVFAGLVRMDSTEYANGRRGVCTIDGFYRRVLGGHPIPKEDDEWQAIPEDAFKTATNGVVFTDPKGSFTKKREQLLAYYPDAVWYEKIARTLMTLAQTGQYNYSRCMARMDYVAANLALARYMEAVLQLVYLLNRTYAPYYKWLRVGIRSLEILPELGDIMRAIADMPSQREAWKNYTYNGAPNPNDMVAMTIEIVAGLIVEALQKMGLSDSDDTYLEAQGREVIRKMEASNRQKERDEMIKLIVTYEFAAFNQVENEGGRASCQNNFPTFSIMRKSQYMTWTDDMLEEYLWYFDDCMKKGRNLITEKYGRMMESTAPEQYAKIKDAFIELSPERKQIQEAIIAIQVAWMQEFAAKYPKMAANARSIETDKDGFDNTSFETYLRGELGTYSDALLKLYGQFVAEIAESGGNLTQQIMTNTAKLYGYESVDEAEEKLM